MTFRQRFTETYVGGVIAGLGIGTGLVILAAILAALWNLGTVVEGWF